MASAEVVTACENVCRDVQWFAAAWDAIIQSAPVLAVIWAICAFFSQRANDRKSELRHLKRKLYADLLRQLSVAFNDITPKDDWEKDERFSSVKNLRNEASLLKEYVDLDVHIERAIDAIRGKYSPERRGKADPTGSAGLALSAENADYTDQSWPTNREVFNRALKNLQENMRKDLSC